MKENAINCENRHWFGLNVYRHETVWEITKGIAKKIKVEKKIIIEK